jgi:multiple sugar transport system permease protein
MTASTQAPNSTGGQSPRRGFDRRRATLHGFLIVMSVVWLLPLLWALYTSLRPYSDTAQNGYVSVATSLTLDNYVRAWNDAELIRYFLNTAVIVIPAVIIVLFLASMLAFVLSRYSFKFNLAMLLLFLGLNMLPPQVLITPLYQIFRRQPDLLYDQYLGIAIVHIAFQLGFCTFVLSNYMKTLPRELNEAALVDGASVWKTFYAIIMPLTRPALAALAVLQVTWIYNDFFWALFLMSNGSKFPITSALNNLKGQYFVDMNLVAAASLLVALPTLIVFFALQKQFISGLTLGSTKG